MDPTNVSTSGFYKGEAAQLASSDINSVRVKNTGVTPAGDLNVAIPISMDDSPFDATITDRHARVAYNPKKIMIEYIENLPVIVLPPVGCPICLTECEGGLEGLTIPAYVPDNENCITNWHSFCQGCLTDLLSSSPVVCPLCRGPFTNIEPLQGWDKQLSGKKQVYFQPEILSCPGCDAALLRAGIRDHLVNCQNNKVTLDQSEAEYRASYLSYLKQHNASMGLILGRDRESRPMVVLYKSDDQGKFQKHDAEDFIASNPKVGNKLHNTSIGSEHQLFMTSLGDQTPVAGLIQFEPVNAEQDSLQLKELPSITSSLRPANRNDMATLRSMPDKYQQLLTLNLASVEHNSAFMNVSCAHAFTTLQHTNAPVALSLQASKAAVDGFSLFATGYQKVKSTFLIYGIKIPGSAAYWGIQKIEADKRIVLEASKHYQLIGLESMTRQEEADIQKATGQSVRENRSNSIKYTLMLATLMETATSRFPLYSQRLSARGHGMDMSQSGNVVEVVEIIDSDDECGYGGFDGEVNESDPGPYAYLASDSTYTSSPTSTSGFRNRFLTGGETRLTGTESTGWRPPQRAELTTDFFFGSSGGSAGSVGEAPSQRVGFGTEAFSASSSGGRPLQSIGGVGGLFAVNSAGGWPPQSTGLRAEFFSGDSSHGNSGLFGRVGDGVVFGTLTSGGGSFLRPKGGQSEPEIIQKAFIKEEIGQPVIPASDSRAHLENMSPELKKALTFKSDVTIKKLSDQVVPTGYRNKRSFEAVQNLCPDTLMPQALVFLDVDVLCTPCPISSKEPPVGLLLEAAEQQMHILYG